jgi:hypothetical protein
MDRTGRQVTRTEIADVIQEAFQSGPAHRDDLLTTAVRKRARPQMIDLLRNLPRRRFAELRQLWGEMPEVPVKRSRTGRKWRAPRRGMCRASMRIDDCRNDCRREARMMPDPQ